MHNQLHLPMKLFIFLLAAIILSHFGGLWSRYDGQEKFRTTYRARDSGSRDRKVSGFVDRPPVSAAFAGLVNAPVLTLAPLFAAAFATHNCWDTFLVGLAASLGAGMSMAFVAGFSDNGSPAESGQPVFRGCVAGLMTAAGGIGPALPFLISNFRTAFFVAAFVVAVELAAISYIRYRYLDTPLLRSAFQVVVGGVLVFVMGILIGRL